MRRLIPGLLFCALATALLPACSAMRVSSHVERGVDFTRYRTFDWGIPDALPTGDPRLDNDRYFEDRVEGAIEKLMAERGYTRVEPGAAPDVRIHYHAVVDRRLDINEADRRDGICRPEGCTPGIVDYQQGTLVVDLVDVRTNRLVWRGWAQEGIDGVLGNRERLAARIDRSISGLATQLPAAR
jgi:hypothetical protein